MHHARRHHDALLPSPIDPSWVVAGDPVAHATRWGGSPDGRLTTFVWSCTAGTFDWRFGCDEIIHVVEGSVTVTSPEGVTTTLGVGDSGYFPAGTVWRWQVPTYVRKHATLVAPVPGVVTWCLGLARRAKQLVTGSRTPSPASP
ncbi:cupin domain-containing protein [Arsenicicoccus dermatophilus]|uniref:cupin domain-containing protein n=1 Tax=Arsenicicoccus dermatophilus TaxID=1076331 RepID=UPI00391736FE